MESGEAVQATRYTLLPERIQCNFTSACFMQQRGKHGLVYFAPTIAQDVNPNGPSSRSASLVCNLSLSLSSIVEWEKGGGMGALFCATSRYRTQSDDNREGRDGCHCNGIVYRHKLEVAVIEGFRTGLFLRNVQLSVRSVGMAC